MGPQNARLLPMLHRPASKILGSDGVSAGRTLPWALQKLTLTPDDVLIGPPFCPDGGFDGKREERPFGDCQEESPCLCNDIHATSLPRNLSELPSATNERVQTWSTFEALQSDLILPFQSHLPTRPLARQTEPILLPHFPLNIQATCCLCGESPLSLLFHFYRDQVLRIHQSPGRQPQAPESPLVLLLPCGAPPCHPLPC